MAKQAASRQKRAVRGSATGRPIMALLDLLGRRWTLAHYLGAARRPADLAGAARRLRRRLADGAAGAADANCARRGSSSCWPAMAIGLTPLGQRADGKFSAAASLCGAVEQAKLAVFTAPLARRSRISTWGAVTHSRGVSFNGHAATVRLAPSACTILTRLPAGASGPATRQIVSSIRTVPVPSMIGFSSVNTRPTSASVRLLRNGLLWLRLLAARDAPPQRHRGDREHREHQDLHLPGQVDRERQQPDQQRGKPEPEHEDARRQQFQRHQDEAEDQPVPGAQRRKHLGHDMTLSSAQTNCRIRTHRCGATGGGIGRCSAPSTRRAAAAADARFRRRSPWRSRRCRPASPACSSPRSAA